VPLRDVAGRRPGAFGFSRDAEDGALLPNPCHARRPARVQTRLLTRPSTASLEHGRGRHAANQTVVVHRMDFARASMARPTATPASSGCSRPAGRAITSRRGKKQGVEGRPCRSRTTTRPRSPPRWPSLDPEDTPAPVPLAVVDATAIRDIHGRDDCRRTGSCFFPRYRAEPDLHRRPANFNGTDSLTFTVGDATSLGALTGRSPSTRSRRSGAVLISSASDRHVDGSAGTLLTGALTSPMSTHAPSRA